MSGCVAPLWAVDTTRVLERAEHGRGRRCLSRRKVKVGDPPHRGVGLCSLQVHFSETRLPRSATHTSSSYRSFKGLSHPATHSLTQTLASHNTTASVHSIRFASLHCIDLSLRPSPPNVISHRLIPRLVNKKPPLPHIFPNQHSQLLCIIPHFLEIKLTREIRKQ